MATGGWKKIRGILEGKNWREGKSGRDVVEMMGDVDECVSVLDW
jgi:hypothetical protein